MDFFLLVLFSFKSGLDNALPQACPWGHFALSLSVKTDFLGPLGPPFSKGHFFFWTSKREVFPFAARPCNFVFLMMSWLTFSGLKGLDLGPRTFFVYLHPRDRTPPDGPLPGIVVCCARAQFRQHGRCPHDQLCCSGSEELGLGKAFYPPLHPGKPPLTLRPFLWFLFLVLD